jgi:hypothetical protein
MFVMGCSTAENIVNVTSLGRYENGDVLRSDLQFRDFNHIMLPRSIHKQAMLLQSITLPIYVPLHFVSMVMRPWLPEA